MARTPGSDRGAAFWRWLRAQPPTRRRLVLAGLVLGWLVVWYAALLALHRWLSDESGWAEPLPGMVGAVVGGGLVLWLQRRRMGSWAHVWELERARRTGRLPDDADPAEWDALLERARRFQRGARSVALAFTLLAVVVVVVGFAWAGFGWIAVLVAALVGLAGVALLEVASRRQSARIDLLRDQVRTLPSG